MWFQNSEAAVAAINMQTAVDALRHGEPFEAIGDDDDECSPPRSNLFLGCLSSTANGLRNAFVLVQITRFQQVIGVYTLQAPSESAKASGFNHSVNLFSAPSGTLQSLLLFIHHTYRHTYIDTYMPT